MAKVEKSIIINAPVEKVFAYVQEPENLLEFWPSLIEVKDVEWLPNGGTRFRWVAKMAGLRFQGTSEDIEVVANQRVVNKTKGGIESKIIWTYQPEGDGTKVVYEGEYTVPIPLLGRLAEAVILKQNENEAELILANLKARMEN
jgi:coenzyme Q-binding protein COQ10